MKALALFLCLTGQLLIAEPSVLTDTQPSETSAQTDQGGGSDINSLFSGVNAQSAALKLQFTNLPSHP